ncbi:N-acetylglucosamine-specific PTS transporter subunit IIBC [Parendozoicomonas haliclonae]|uniref:PTS system glucose-specific EIICBA component n=1 Tax=Parendozoicomonas haliclonae TaxID=1960125 RepID=A0A1X7AFG5_9GAMM|nr:N-acetylglucosamine-specific PTS transporter subunit IIBC [Parendozoicomonas haliclonae]SMA36285.1 PTS system glucose-specific EIICBA component [Parendozoicomonas haliclonae]
MNVLGYLQSLGKALMLPIAVLPVAALLLRLGQPDLLNIAFIAKAGDAIFSHLPILFAMGIAVGLSCDGAGAAALAGAVGYFILTAASGTINDSINMSFFGGIIAGVVAGHSYNRFHDVELPSYLGFFSGQRLVPIVTGLFMLLIAWGAGYVWPTVQAGIDAFGRGVSESGSLGHFVYGVLNRGLIPFGLHHVLNSYFWFGLGEFASDAGTVVTGDLNRFFVGDKTAGVFMTGFFPVMMFGLPAAALAMYLAARKERKTQVGGVLLSVGLTAFLTGITEPVEFLFMFLAPVLYITHAILTGLSLVVTNGMGTLHGFGFSAGLFDFALNWGLATNPATLIGIGLAFGAAYFVVFYFLIKMLNLKTLGREDVWESTVPIPAEKKGADNVIKESSFPVDPEVQSILQALGGLENIIEIDACITRMRLTLRNSSVVDEPALMLAGASGVVRLGSQNLQIILGAKAEVICRQIKKLQRLS